ncbi:MAG: class I SAM-dependent methyltransferase family protein [Candidatus Kerfeldbacteria bacterium]|nr:class I SAM-dependent methyltransferase family protein [Candidatus Kerfeldbacteria bacterium]
MENKDKLVIQNYYKVDISEEYEVMTPVSKVLNFFWISFSTIIPYSISHRLLVASKKAEIIKANSTQYRALEEMYTFHQKSRNILNTRFFDYLWLNQKNPKALRNRLKLFKKLLTDAINRNGQDETRILSLGCGSARGVVETIAEIKKDKKNIHAKLIDQDLNAINYSKELAHQFKIDYLISQHNIKIEDSYSIIKSFNPNIIEMVGILDYFKDERVVRVINSLYDVLDHGSILITGNINKNIEERFISKTVKWQMIHRYPKDFYKVLCNTKFESLEIIYEPLLVHGIALLIKK